MDVDYVLMLAPTVLAASEKIADSDESDSDGSEEDAGEEEEGEKKAGEEKARKRAAERSTGAERKRQKVEKEVSRCYLKFEEELFVKVSRSQLLCVVASPGSAEGITMACTAAC